MKQLALFVIALSACAQHGPSQRYGFIARLGNDTISVESVTRTGDNVVSDEVDRFPRVRQRHTEITLGPDGGIRHLVMDIRTPSEPANQRERRVVADVDVDSVRISKTDQTGEKHIALAVAPGVPTMAHLPQMYSLIDLYFQAAFKRADSTRLAAGDSVLMHQFYIDREFDRFPLHDGFVRPIAPNKAELWHDWLAGIAEATFDSTHRMLTYSGQRTTYKVEVTRLAELPDVATIGEQFAVRETKSGMSQLSVRDTTRANIGNATFTVDYGRPLARGRVLVGNIIAFDEVWRTGANAASQFTTSAPITIAGMPVPAGKYTLWTRPRSTGGVDIIVNKQVGQWGTGYDASYDLGHAPVTVETTATPVEKFTISINATDAQHGTLVMEWGTFRWTAPMVVR